MIECQTYGLKSELVRSITSHGMKYDYVCRNCNIAWYIDEAGKYRIRLSTTNVLAGKLKDHEFEKMLDILREYSQQKAF